MVDLNTTPLQTAEGRRQAIESTAALFRDHLLTSPGTVLPSAVRLGIAKCAAAALTCDGCDDLARDACLAKSVSFADVCADIDHTCAVCDLFPTDLCDLSSDAAAALTSSVHAIVRHQGRLNETWYQDTIDAFQRTGVVGKGFREGDDDGGGKDDPERTAVCAAFCEVAFLSACASGVQVMRMIVDVAFRTDPDAPKPALLPTWKELSEASLPEPLGPHFPSFLRRGVRRDADVAFAPYFLSADVDVKHPEFLRLPVDVQNLLSGLPDTKGPLLPASCFAPTDFLLFERLAPLMYIPLSDVIKLHKPLEPTRNCPTVSRHDLEAVAGSLAQAFLCSY